MPEFNPNVPTPADVLKKVQSLRGDPETHRRTIEHELSELETKLSISKGISPQSFAAQTLTAYAIRARELLLQEYRSWHTLIQ